MYCPDCNVEYRSGFTACSDCGATLLEGLPPEPQPRHLDAPASLEQVFLGDDPLQAEVVAATLREEGIEAIVRTRFAGGMTLTPAETHWAPGQQRIVLVPSLAAPQAREIVESIGSAEPELNEASVTPVPEPIEPGGNRRGSKARVVAVVILAPVLATLAYAVFMAVVELFR